MYGENGGRLRAELGELLRQHRIQVRIGGAGTHTVPVTTTPEERQQIGEQIRRYRQSALLWCHQATVAVAPGAASALSKAPTNPFRAANPHHGALAALQRALEHSVRTSTAALPTIEELTTPNDRPLVEHWRQLARSAALGEHDFAAALDSGLGHGRLDAQQRQTVIGDVAAIVRALVMLDQRYAHIPGWEKLNRPDRLGWSALACALDASLDPPDYSVDLRGWRPPTKVIKGTAKPGLLGVLQAEHNLVIRLQAFPSAVNLRLVVDSQRLLSGSLARLAEPIEPALQQKWLVREQTYTALQQELRNIAGRIGHGSLAAAEGANAVSRLKATPSSTELDPRALHGFDQLFTRLDTRVADVVEDGISRNAYLTRVRVPRLDANSGQMVAPTRARYVPLAEAQHTAIVDLVRTHLRPVPEPPTAPPGAARSRAELHAAIVHRPGGGQGPGLAL